MITDQQKTKASKQLKRATRRWFEAVVEDWDLEPSNQNGFGQ